MKQIFLFLAAVAAVSGAYAEGYQVNNMSAKQTGMGHVGAAMKLNSESIFFNPAATAYQNTKFDISAGMTGILSNVRYQSLPTLENDYTSGPIEKSDNKISTPLHIYINYKPIDKLAVGLGFYTPNGSAMKWADNWSGAHVIQDINLKAFTFQPTLSYKICDKLSIGAGLMITWGNFDLSRSMLPIGSGNQTLTAGFTQAAGLLSQMAQQPGLSPEQAAAYQAMVQQAQAGASYFQSQLTDAPIVSAKLKGDANVAIGVNAGMLWNITDEWSVAMTYRSRMNMKVDKGRGKLNYGTPEAQQYLTFLNQVLTSANMNPAIPGLDQGTFNAELPLPTSVTWGVSFRPTPAWEFAVDLQWVGWSAYKALNVEFNEKELGVDPIYSVKNYSNTLAFRFGGQFHANDWLTARMGMYVDESPVSSDYLNPETPSMTKVSYTAGVSFRPTSYMSIDLAYAYVSSADPERSGSYPLYNYYTGKLESVFSGNYRLHANVFSIGVGFSF